MNRSLSLYALFILLFFVTVAGRSQKLNDRRFPFEYPSATRANDSVMVSVLTGVISGFLPAWRAARMDPVEALRSE